MGQELQPNWLLQLPQHLERQFFEESSVQRCDCSFSPSSVSWHWPAWWLSAANCPSWQGCCTVAGSCTGMPMHQQHTCCTRRVYVMFDMLAILQAVLFNWWLLKKLGMVGSQVSGCSWSVNCFEMLFLLCLQCMA